MIICYSRIAWKGKGIFQVETGRYAQLSAMTCSVRKPTLGVTGCSPHYAKVAYAAGEPQA